MTCSLGLIGSALLLLTGTPDISATDRAFAEAGTQFVKLLAGGRYGDAAAMFDKTMTDVVSLRALEASWSDPTKDMGEIREIGNPTVSSFQQYTLVFVPIELTNGRLRMKVVLDQRKRVSGYFWVKPADRFVGAKPKYLRTDGILERDVTVGRGLWKLPGALCLPKVSPVRAGIVLVHGSGPNDRDETIGPNKPFRDLAIGLANEGIATLRYDKRTKEHALKASIASITVKAEVIDDALLALQCLRSQQELADVPTYVLGHSLGATLAPEIAAGDSRVAGVIMLAGGARDFEDIILDQFEYLCSLTAGPESQQRLSEIRQQVQALRERRLKPGERVLGADATYWYDLCERDGRAAVRKAAALKCRILVLQGGRDYQSTVDDFKLWQEGLAAHPAATFKLFDNLNHLFAGGEGKAVPAEYMENKHVDPRVIDAVAQWCAGADTAATSRPTSQIGSEERTERQD
jgi:uncharacterized protein